MIRASDRMDWITISVIPKPCACASLKRCQSDDTFRAQLLRTFNFTSWANGMTITLSMILDPFMIQFKRFKPKL